MKPTLPQQGQKANSSRPQYCEGYYEPRAVPNATVSRSDITRNFTYCSPRSANFQFDPRDALQRDLNASGNSWLNVSDLNWPDEIDRGIDAIHIVQRVAFIICACPSLLRFQIRILTKPPQTAYQSG